MRKLLFVIFILSVSILKAQTILTPGDIMFIGLNSDPVGSPKADEFNVLILEPIASGTVIYFTDMGYTGNSAPFFQQNENNGCDSGTGSTSDGIIKWTATDAVPTGTQLVIRVRITGVNGPTANIGTVTTIVETTTSGTSMSLSAAGEVVHAFQGAINGSNHVTEATMLASIHYNNTGWNSNVNTCQFSSTISENPNTGYDVFYVDEFDNGFYSGSMSGDKASLQAAILDVSNNWTRTDDNSGYTFPITGNFTLNNIDFEENDGIKIFPNPTSGLVYINNDVKKMTLYNSLGKQLIITTKNKLDIQSYKSGLYILKIETKKGISFKKIIKQ